MKHTLLKTLTFLWLLTVWHPMHAQQWENILPPNNSYYPPEPYFYNADTGWIMWYQRVYYTKNGGTTLQLVYQMPDSLIEEGQDSFAKMYPINDTTAYLYIWRGGGYRMYKTTNGGFTFTDWEYPTVADFEKRIYISEDTVIAKKMYPPPASIVYSFDGGKNWNDGLGVDNIDIRCLSKTPEGKLFAFSGAMQPIFYSIDCGQTWQTKPPIASSGSEIINVSFLDEQRAVALGHSFIIVTDDGFNSIKYAHEAVFTEIFYQKENAIWLMHPNQISLSTNGGESFETYQTLGFDNVRSLHFRDNVGFAGGIKFPNTGVILKYVDTTTTIVSMEISYDDIFIFPNPVNNELVAQLPPLAVGNLTVSVLSLDGKSLLTTEIFIYSGKHNFTLPLHNLSTGVYLLMVNSNKFSGTTKFIINH